MDTALPQKFPFILDRNLAKANCTKNRVFTSCDTAVLDPSLSAMAAYVGVMGCGDAIWQTVIVFNHHETVVFLGAHSTLLRA